MPVFSCFEALGSAGFTGPNPIGVIIFDNEPPLDLFSDRTSGRFG